MIFWNAQMDQLEAILLVTADPALRGAMADLSASTGAWDMRTCDTAVAARAQLQDAAQRPGALLIDVDLPDQDGYTLCRRLCDDETTPLIMLLARGVEDGDVVRGLAAGAANFVTLPFRASEMRARITTLLRLRAQRLDATLRIGRFVVDPLKAVLLDADRNRSPLTAKEIAILKFLHRAGGEVVSRHELLRRVWNYSGDADTHTIQTHIHRLRKKFGDIDRDSHPIQTSRDGYRLAMS